MSELNQIALIAPVSVTNSDGRIREILSGKSFSCLLTGAIGNVATPINDAERQLEGLQDGIKRLVPEMVEANQARARAH